MADDAAQLKIITDNIEAMYQSLRQAASNIAGLLSVGRATCDEVKAYNLWALATYNTQRGMLATLRANGETGVPELPAAPTLFTWKGTQGADAWQLDCTGEPQSLSGLMGRVMKGPATNTPYLSTNEIQISTQDPHAFDPSAAPTFSTLLQVQQARASQTTAGMGFIGVLIVIAGIALAVSVAIVAIMSYLKTSEVQAANTEQTKLQAAAFANYTQARLSCYGSCMQSGKNADDCTSFCAKLITKPDIKLPGQIGSWGALQWIGFTVVAGAGLTIAWKLYQRHQSGKPMFQLPEVIDAAINPAE